jgi:uncharacterized protein (TIGR03118 family)
MFHWTRGLFRTRHPRHGGRNPARARLSVELLESRCVMSGNVLQTNLVSDLPGVAAVTDPNLVNPWGISESGGSPFWISDNNAGATTLYNTAGQPVPIVKGLTQNFATIPAPGDPTGNGGTPTGTVFNTDLGGGGFQITNGTKSAPAIFLFVTEDGTIVGWNPGINPAGSDPAKAGTFATIAVDNSGNNFTEPDPLKQTGAVYKGLAIASDPNGPIFTGDAASTTVLYAANFRSGQIEVYGTDFKSVTAPGAFSDPNLPDGYAPFNVQVLNNLVYVTYAKQDAAKHDDVAGEGRGFVDVFNLNGTPAGPGGKPRLVSRGPLDSPWGLAIAPQGFAGITAPNNDPVLLVGNFGNGLIHAFDASTGAFLDTLKDLDGEPIQIDGLWALKVGNGGNGGAANTVYFTAGLDHEMHGLFGSLRTPLPGDTEGPAEAQKVQVALDVFQLDLNTVLNDIKTNAPPATLRQDLRTLNQDFITLVRAEVQFAIDSFQDQAHGGSGASSGAAGSSHGDHDSGAKGDSRHDHFGGAVAEAVDTALDPVFAELAGLDKLLDS